MSATIVSPVKSYFSKRLSMTEHDFESADSQYFYLAGIMTAPVFGLLAGVANRGRLLMMTALAAGLSVALCAHMPSNMFFFLFRYLAGAAYGGTHPVVMSMFGDWFDARERQKVAGMITASIGGGNFLGLIVMDVFLSQMPSLSYISALFMMLGLLMGAVGIFFYHTVDEPVRGCNEEGDNKEESAPLTKQSLMSLFSATNLFTLILSFPGFIPYSLVQNHFKEIDLGAGLMFMTGFGMLVGILVSSLAADRLALWNKKFPALYASACALLRIIPGVFVLGPGKKSAILMFTFGFMSAQHIPVIATMLLNANLPRLRGLAAALGVFFEDLSRASGPLLFNAFFFWSGGATNEDRRTHLLYWVVGVWLICGVGLLPTIWTYPHDEKAMRALIEQEREERVRRSEKRESNNVIAAKAVLAAEAFQKR